jgi:hypothetical protein
VTWDRVPIVRVVVAWWRVRVRRHPENAELPPAIRLFDVGELLPLKGVVWRVEHRGPHGIVLAPRAVTARLRKLHQRITRVDHRPSVS